jgi:hypothetical protein
LASVQGMRLNPWAMDCLDAMVQFLVTRDY